MKLPKPDKLGFAIFIFLAVLSAPVFFGYIPGLKTLAFGEIFGKAYFLFFLFDYFLLFKLFHNLGLPVGGYTGGWWSFPNPNALGSFLIILTNIIVYYLIAIFLASRIKNERNKTIATRLVRTLTVLFILLFTASALPATIMQNRMARCSHQCLPPAEQSYSACCDNCRNSFPEWDTRPTNAMPPAYQTCMDTCFQVREDRIRECNASCLKK